MYGSLLINKEKEHYILRNNISFLFKKDYKKNRLKKIESVMIFYLKFNYGIATETLPFRILPLFKIVLQKMNVKVVPLLTTNNSVSGVELFSINS